MSELLIHNVRGNTVESTHHVSVAVTDSEGTLVARAGDPARVTFMRSAAKPFQALPLVEDGAAERFAISSTELALACASHNSEEFQVNAVHELLARLEFSEGDLICGPHAPLWKELSVIGDARNPEIAGVAPSPIANNCSGKHTGMLALAKYHDWETRGYHEIRHPVQQRIVRELPTYIGMTATEIGHGTDGCGVPSFTVPLASLATAYARLATSDATGPTTVVSSMLRHPEFVAGTGRLDTELMRRYEGRLLVKVGAGGVYAGAFIPRGWGLALKVEDGDNRAAIVAVMAVLGQLGVEPPPGSLVPEAQELPIRNTREDQVGVIRAEGEIAFV
ncbi:MAG: asparaginase [Gemmatimonadales bacterium]